jgi:hypothetical protein
MFLKGKGNGNFLGAFGQFGGEKGERERGISSSAFLLKNSTKSPESAEAHKFHGNQSKAVDCMGEQLRAFELQKNIVEKSSQ